MDNVDQEFSRFLKVQKLKYLSNEKVEWETINSFLSHLSLFNLSTLITDNDKKAFWINVYNGLMNYWILKKGICKKVKEDPKIFVFYKVNIGGYKLTLDQIEHGILRRNSKTIYRPFAQFFIWDKRKNLICNKLDHRIHFALNCGANSCPAIAFYDSSNIDDQLHDAESVFAQINFIVREKERELEVSRIFSWYKKDFIAVYLNDVRYQRYNVIFKEYDWSIH